VRLTFLGVQGEPCAQEAEILRDLGLVNSPIDTGVESEGTGRALESMFALAHPEWGGGHVREDSKDEELETASDAEWDDLVVLSQRRASAASAAARQWGDKSVEVEPLESLLYEPVKLRRWEAPLSALGESVSQVDLGDWLRERAREVSELALGEERIHDKGDGLALGEERIHDKGDGLALGEELSTIDQQNSEPIQELNSMVVAAETGVAEVEAIAKREAELEAIAQREAELEAQALARREEARAAELAERQRRATAEREEEERMFVEREAERQRVWEERQQRRELAAAMRREEAATRRRLRAVLTIQCNVRGWAARRAFEEMRAVRDKELARVRAQRAARAREAREIERRRREEAAAVARELQRAAEAERQRREEQERLMWEREAAAAAKIQALLRGVLERRVLEARKAANAVVVRAARGWMGRNEARRRVRALFRVQAFARRCLARLHLLKALAAAVKVQSWFRGRLGQRTFQRGRHAVTVIQLAVRKMLARRSALRRRLELQRRLRATSPIAVSQDSRLAWEGDAVLTGRLRPQSSHRLFRPPSSADSSDSPPRGPRSVAPAFVASVGLQRLWRGYQCRKAWQAASEGTSLPPLPHWVAARRHRLSRAVRSLQARWKGQQLRQRLWHALDASRLDLPMQGYNGVDDVDAFLGVCSSSMEALLRDDPAPVRRLSEARLAPIPADIKPLPPPAAEIPKHLTRDRVPSPIGRMTRPGTSDTVLSEISLGAGAKAIPKSPLAVSRQRAMHAPAWLPESSAVPVASSSPRPPASKRRQQTSPRAKPSAVPPPTVQREGMGVVARDRLAYRSRRGKGYLGSVPAAWKATHLPPLQPPG
jgi:hypothetical protein